MDLKNELDKTINELSQLYNNAHSQSMKKHYVDDYNFFTNFYSTHFSDDYPMNDECYNLILKVYNSFFKTYKISLYTNKHLISSLSSNYLKKLRKYNLQEINYYNEKYYHYSEIKDILLDFFNQYTPQYYKSIKDMIDNNIYFLDDSQNDICGECLYSNSNNAKYIIIYNKENKNNIFTLETLAHEFGHLISFEILKDKGYQQRRDISSCNFCETPSSIFEKLFLDFVDNNKIDNNISIANNNYLTLLENYLYDLNLLSNMKSYDNLDFFLNIVPNKEEINKTAHLARYYKECPDCPIQSKDSYSYSYGQLISLEYSRLYKQDSKLTIKNISNFINCISLYDDDYMFNHFGLNMDSILHCEALDEELKTNKEKIKEIKYVQY